MVIFNLDLFENGCRHGFKNKQDLLRTKFQKLEIYCNI